MNLYTRTGDDGTTGLFGGDRVSKDHPRVAAYGTVDELNACVGLAVAACGTNDEYESHLLRVLGELQSRLFDIGADLAAPIGSKHEDKITRIDSDDVTQVEAWIDQIDAENEPMKCFVLPGGTELAARLHLARTICRRAEREVIALARVGPVNEQLRIYLNRISDLLFAMARRANKQAGVPDVPWTGQ
ncbi:MAG: cob(I)yrinic acid a,c-diamide adenosyltransferase [Phycisphaerales bacterium]